MSFGSIKDNSGIKVVRIRVGIQAKMIKIMVGGSIVH